MPITKDVFGRLLKLGSTVSIFQPSIPVNSAIFDFLGVPTPKNTPLIAGVANGLYY